MDFNQQFFLISGGFIIILIFSLMVTRLGGDPGSLSSRGLIKEAEAAVKNNPGKNQPVFNLAYIRLTNYIYYNQNQNRRIYWLIIIFSIAGFVMIGFGLWDARTNSYQLWLALVAGTITEVIAAVIAYIYRSVFQQAVEYSKTLERMVSIGMSIQILDDLASDDATSKEIKTATKAEIAKMLLEIHKATVHVERNSSNSDNASNL